MTNQMQSLSADLLAIGRGAWDELSQATNVPRSTIEKIAYQVTKNPLFETVSRLRDGIEKAAQKASVS